MLLFDYAFHNLHFVFAGLVEEGYHQNPYHNAIHAADVTQAMHCYIMQEKVRTGVFHAYCLCAARLFYALQSKLLTATVLSGSEELSVCLSIS